MKTEISVLLFCYSKTDVLRKSIESFINQNFPVYAYEIIFVTVSISADSHRFIRQFVNSGRLNAKIVPHTCKNFISLINESVCGKIIYPCADFHCADKYLLDILHKFFTKTKPEPDIICGKIIPEFKTTHPKWVSPQTKLLLGIPDYGHKPHKLTGTDHVFFLNTAFRKSLLTNPVYADYLRQSFYLKHKLFEIEHFTNNIKPYNPNIIYSPEIIVHQFVDKQSLSILNIFRLSFIKGLTVNNINRKWTDKNRRFFLQKLIVCLYKIIYRLIFIFPVKANKPNMEILIINFYKTGNALRSLIHR